MASDDEKLDSELEREKSLVDLEEAIKERERLLAEERAERLDADREQLKRDIGQQSSEDPPED